MVTEQGTAADGGPGVQKHLQGLRLQAAQGGNAGGKKAVFLFLFPRPRCYSIIRSVFFRSRQTSVWTRKRSVLTLQIPANICVDKEKVGSNTSDPGKRLCGQGKGRF